MKQTSELVSQAMGSKSKLTLGSDMTVNDAKSVAVHPLLSVTVTTYVKNSFEFVVVTSLIGKL